MSRTKKDRHPILKIRKEMPPPTKRHPNPRKEQSRQACRNNNQTNLRQLVEQWDD